MWALRTLLKHKQTENCDGKPLSVGKYPKWGCLAGLVVKSHGETDNLKDSQVANSEALDSRQQAIGP